MGATRKAILHQPSVLIVDDQAMDIEIPFILASEMGFDVTITFDGQDALNQIRRKHFDLVILDWHMPVMPGWTFLRKIQEQDESRRRRRPMNIVLYSADDLEFESFEGTPRVNIVDIWKKPLRPIDALKRLKRVREEFE